MESTANAQTSFSSWKKIDEEANILMITISIYFSTMFSLNVNSQVSIKLVLMRDCREGKDELYNGQKTYLAASLFV